MKNSLIAWLVVVVLLESCLLVFGQGAGFQLRGPLTFGGYSAGDPIWAIGKGIRIVAVDPVLHKHLLELEAQRVQVTIELPQ